MAFQPSIPGSTMGPMKGGVPPPPMMMNPSQFIQNGPAQIPLPTEPIAPLVGTISEENRHYQQGMNYGQAPIGAVFQANEHFSQHPQNQDSHHPPDSTSNIYQKAGVYDNYAANQSQQPAYVSSGWGYSVNGAHNIHQPQMPQGDHPLPSSADNYSQQQQFLYPTYNSQQGHVNSTSPGENVLYGQNTDYNSYTLGNAVHSGNQPIERGQDAYTQQTNLGAGNIIPSTSVNNDVPYLQQYEISGASNPVQESSREGSASRPDLEQVPPLSNAKMEANYVEPRGVVQQHQEQTMFQHLHQQHRLFSEASSSDFQGPAIQKLGGEMNVNKKQIPHPESLQLKGDENDNISTVSHDNVPASNVIASAPTQPDIVSATASSTSASSTFQSLSFTSKKHGVSTFNHVISQAMELPPPSQTWSAVGSNNNFESHGGQKPVIYQHENPPDSLPPLTQPYTSYESSATGTSNSTEASPTG